MGDEIDAARGQPEAAARETRRLPAKGHSGEALDVYSNWLHAGGNSRRRGGVPPSLYNLQAYKSWAAKIRRDWKAPESSEA